MTALLIILGVITGLGLVLSIPVVFDVEYVDTLWLRMRWLFLKKQLIPATKEDEEGSLLQTLLDKFFGGDKNKEEAPQEQAQEDKPPNAFTRFYANEGLAGLIELLRRTVAALKKFRHGLWLGFCIREFHLAVHLSSGDPQELAVRYGKVSAAIFPPLGWLTAKLRSKKGRVRAHITPDFTGKTEREIACTATVSIIPSVLLGATVMLAVRVLFKVVLRFLRGANKKTTSASGQPSKKGT